MRAAAAGLAALTAIRLAIAAILPLPKKRDAIDPTGFTRRHGNNITRWVGIIRNDGQDSCLR